MLDIRSDAARRGTAACGRTVELVHGYRAATMDDVVRASGLSKGSLYRFFESKEQLLVALFETFDAQIATELETASAQSDPLAAFEHIGDVVLATLTEQRELVQAWLEFFAHRDLRARFTQI